ncbi:MAG: phosphoglycerate kinase [archaeon]|nr:phosphoglycerate kinase [archaeon]
MRDFHTLDDFEFTNKTVLLRVDINCPLQRDSLEIEDDSRIRKVIPTIRELIEKKAKLVIIAHQGRKGKWDCVSLNRHSEKLAKYLGSPVKYVDDIIGNLAKAMIKKLKAGETLLLDNVRKLDFETAKVDMFEHAKGKLVSELVPLINFYVCDAFSAAHRSQCSLVGFPIKVPSAAGRLMEREIHTLKTALDKPKKPSVFILGGVKIGDISKIIDHTLETNMADVIILVGLAGYMFLMAKGVNLGKTSTEIMKEVTNESIQIVRNTLSKYQQRILLPIDAAVEKNGKRTSISVENFPVEESVMDIGDHTIKKFSEIIISSKTSLMSGPAGVYEKKGFGFGTKCLMNAMIESGGQSIIGGGHTTAAADAFGLTNKFFHVSTGGGSLEMFLLGEPLPAINALKYSYSKL